MEHKNIDNLNSQKYNFFMRNNHNSELITAVNSRQKQFVDENLTANKRNDEMRRKQIDSFETKMAWMDMVQFNEKKKYRDYTKFLILIFIVFLVSAILVGFGEYYTSSECCIYTADPHQQALYVNGIESLLLKMGVITTNPWYGVSETTFPRMDMYWEGTSTVVLSILFLVSFYTFLILGIFHSPLAKEIYNIQDGNKSQKFRVIQNKEGYFGICKLGFHKLTKILPFEYDKITMIEEGSYICKKGSKVGLYNTDAKRFTVPVIYDDVYFIDKTSLLLIKDNEVYSFTHKGYRIVK